MIGVVFDRVLILFADQCILPINMYARKLVGGTVAVKSIHVFIFQRVATFRPDSISLRLMKILLFYKYLACYYEYP